MKRHGHRKMGFSLIEMTVVLAAAGALGLAAWKLLPALRPAAEGDPVRRSLMEAQQAVEGFVLRAHRLPCPDTDGDGLENCTATAVVGKLPYRTLGVSAGQALRYGVNRNANLTAKLDADLAVVKDRFVPSLPVAGASVQQNGLDFCWALRNAISAPGGLTAGTVPVAYAIAHAGGNGAFDGANATTTGFAPPAQPKTGAYDDQVVASGLAELSGRLSCPRLLGEAQGAARAAFAAYDVDRNALMYQRFREFAVSVRHTNTIMAGVNAGLATLDLVNATATGITSVALTLATAGTAGGAIAAAAAAITAASASLVAASASLVSAGLAEQKANQQKTAADAFKANTLLLSAQAMAAALSADRKGLVP